MLSIFEIRRILQLKFQLLTYFSKVEDVHMILQHFTVFFFSTKNITDILPTSVYLFFILQDFDYIAGNARCFLEVNVFYGDIQTSLDVIE